MFSNLRPNSQIYILYKDASPRLDVGSVVSVSMPVPKYPIQPMFGQPQEMVVDITVKVNNQDVTYQKIPANLDIADFNNSKKVDNCVGYDVMYVYHMAKSDFFESSIISEQYLLQFVKDYLDDIDGYDGKALTRFYADCIGSGTPIM